MALCVGIVCLAANSSGNRPSEVGRVPPRARSGVQSDIRISITVCCRLCLDGGALANFFRIFHDFQIIFRNFSDFFLSDGSAVCLVPLQVPVLRPDSLRCCPATRPSKDNEKTEVCAGSDMFQLYAIDTYLSDTCQHPVGTRLVVPVLVCFGSPFVFFRCR